MTSAQVVCCLGILNGSHLQSQIDFAPFTDSIDVSGDRFSTCLLNIAVMLLAVKTFKIPTANTIMTK